MLRRIFACWLVLVLLTLACQVQVNLPAVATPGPLVTDEIHVPAPSAEKVHLRLQFGAGHLALRPGAKNLVDGTATYNVPQFKPEITVGETEVLLSQEKRNLRFSSGWGQNLRNEWDLQIGDQPLELTIEAGAYEAEYEFGALRLTNLTIRDGAATVQGRFSQPNLAEMNVLRYETGASNVTLTGLANANFSLFEFDGGAGNYIFEFGGELRRPASVHLAAGMSNMTLVIPAGLAAQITAEGLVNVNVPPSWTQSGKTYTQAGEGPGLTIVVEMGAANLTVLTTLP